MSKSKKIFAFLMAVAVVSVGLTGCAKKDDANKTVKEAKATVDKNDARSVLTYILEEKSVSVLKEFADHRLEDDLLNDFFKELEDFDIYDASGKIHIDIEKIGEWEPTSSGGKRYAGFAVPVGPKAKKGSSHLVFFLKQHRGHKWILEDWDDEIRKLTVDWED